MVIVFGIVVMVFVHVAAVLLFHKGRFKELSFSTACHL